MTSSCCTIQHRTPYCRQVPSIATMLSLESEIRDQSLLIRDLKSGEHAVEHHEMCNHVFKLLMLKYQYGRLSPTPVTERELFTPCDVVKCIKVRWCVELPDGGLVRLQRPFQDVCEVSGQEVFDAIISHTRKKYPNERRYLGKLEVTIKRDATELKHPSGTDESKWANPKKKRERSDKPIVKSWVAVTPETMFRLPLVVPGPLLADLLVVDLRATWLASPCPFSVDCAVNIFHKSFSHDLQDVIGRAMTSGIEQMVLTGADIESSEVCAKLAQSRRHSLYAVVGVHPLRAETLPRGQVEEVMSSLSRLCAQPGVIAVGEVGLDFKNGTDGEKLQQFWLKKQIALAKQKQLPLFLHDRQSFPSMKRILLELGDSLPKRICINCFSGSQEELEFYVSIGAYIGITGLISKTDRAGKLPELLKLVPKEKLVLGTDAPYLTPETVDGRKLPSRNEPCFLPFLIEKVAQLLRESPIELAKRTTQVQSVPSRVSMDIQLN